MVSIHKLASALYAEFSHDLNQNETSEHALATSSKVEQGT